MVKTMHQVDTHDGHTGLQLGGGKAGRDIAQSVFRESRAVDKGSQINDSIEAKMTVKCFDIGV
ncbi:unnamed protein product [Penicillium viridicatum]